MFGYANIYKHRNISVLILDDNKNHNKYIKNHLTSNYFYPVEVQDNTIEIIRYIKNSLPDIILIGLKFNHKNENISKNIWLKCKIPMIFILDDSDDKKYRDVFLSEPYSFLPPNPHEKLLKTVIESAYYKHIHIETYVQKVTKEPEKFIYLVRDYRFDTKNLKLYKKDKQIKLTKNETKLLHVMSEFDATIAPFKIVYSYIYRDDLYDVGKLRTLIYRFRKKLDFDIFETIPNVGYRLKMA